MRVIKQEFYTKSGLVRTTEHDASKSSKLGLTNLSAPLTGNDLCRMNLQISDLIVVSTVVHVLGVCNCVECKPVWDDLSKPYIFD